MCNDHAQIITARVRENLANHIPTDVYGLARELHQACPHFAEADLVAMVDAAIIGTWDAAAMWDRSSPLNAAVHWQAPPPGLHEAASGLPAIPALTPPPALARFDEMSC